MLANGGGGFIFVFGKRARRTRFAVAAGGAAIGAAFTQHPIPKILSFVEAGEGRAVEIEADDRTRPSPARPAPRLFRAPVLATLPAES